MIFLRYNTNFIIDYPEYPMLAQTDTLNIDFKKKAYADSIFEFVENMTVYHKDRFDSPHGGYQYSPEEQTFIKLTAVPFTKS